MCRFDPELEGELPSGSSHGDILSVDACVGLLGVHFFWGISLDALAAGITRKKVNYVLDADISDFFSKLDHSWLEKFLEHRIADRRVLRLIRKWLNAGVIEDGNWKETTEGSPQGASVSPLLANVYLHYVFDRWARQWRRRHAHGDVVIVRFADDFVCGFERLGD